MDNDVYTVALRHTLNEITSACPDIQSIFLFQENGNMIGGEEKAQEEAAVRAIDTLDVVLEKAKAIGGVQNIVLEGDKATVSVSRVNDYYLVTVIPQRADTKYINALTGIVVPTVLKVLDKINPPSNQESPSEPENEEPTVKPDIKPLEESADETILQTTEPPETPEIVENHEEPEPDVSHEDSLPEPQTSQFIVENIGGLFSPSDIVRVDNETMSQWAELYEDKRIEEVTIETFAGKSARCKLKPIKDLKYEGKGIIQIPEKIQQSLDVKKGELVRVKPIVE